MKKPVILLIDDDASVLESLDALIRPAFSSICLVESFDSPDETLLAVDRWSEERRPIAVAIVDQKMTPLTGVALISSLRNRIASAEFDVVKHMQCALLTGYGGLDSAIDGKNTAKIRRYLEKPWNPESLLQVIRELVRDHLAESGTGAYFEYRELDGSHAEEIRNHFALRYKVFATQSVTEHLLPSDPKVHLDVDEYDPFSRLFGLFASDTVRSRMVGTLRLTADQKQSVERGAREAIADYPELACRLDPPRSERLPMMKYLIDRDAIAQLIAEIDRNGEEFVEPGRLALDPTLQSIPGGSVRHLGRYMIESAAAFTFLVFEYDNCILSCVPSHAPMYQLIGFEFTPGTKKRFHEAFGHDVVCLYGRGDRIPARMRSKVENFANRIKRKGHSCRCPSFPECVPGPYQTGDFEDADVLCPAEAAASLNRPYCRE